MAETIRLCCLFVGSALMIHCSSDGAGSPAAATGGNAGAAQAAGGMATGGTSNGGLGTGGGPAGGGMPGSGAPDTALANDGPFPSQTINDSGPNGNYTIYAPATLAPNGAPDPIVVWMSGGGTTQSIYTLLPHLATHGFVVVASNTTPNVGQEVALGQEMVAGIDWIVAENARQGSVFLGKLDTTKIGAMGYSMGSLATFTIASDPRLTTTVHVSGGNMVADRVSNLRAPAAFFCGITGDACSDLLSMTCDIAAANCDTDFMNATTPVFYGKFPGGHLGILSEPNKDRITAAATAWLKWKLMSDSTLSSMFVGSQCTLCTDPNWNVQEKNL